jgi:hypothetical protein
MIYNVRLSNEAADVNVSKKLWICGKVSKWRRGNLVSWGGVASDSGRRLVTHMTG